MQLSQLQEAIGKLEQEKGWLNTPDQKVVFAMEELGEVAKWVRRARDKELTNDERQELNFEIADVLQHLISLANYFEIEIEEGLAKKKRL